MHLMLQRVKKLLTALLNNWETSFMKTKKRNMIRARAAAGRAETERERENERDRAAIRQSKCFHRINSLANAEERS